MKLTALDLNLLVTFEELYATGSVTLAGQRLNRSQASVSSALGRLRQLFKDELFVRTSDGMVPTDRARALMPGIELALEQLRRALSDSVGFDPKSSHRRRFVVATSDYVDLVLMPAVIALLRQEAPQIELRVTRLNRDEVFSQLDQAGIDLAIGGLLPSPKRIVRERLYDETFLCIGDRDLLKLGGGVLDLDRYVSLPHALFVPGDNGSSRGVIDEALTRLGRQRHVLVTFAHVSALPHVVRGTDLIATVAARVATLLAPEGTSLSPLPVELQDAVFGIDMLYGRRSENDPGAIWLRSLIQRAATRMASDPACAGELT